LKINFLSGYRSLEAVNNTHVKILILGDSGRFCGYNRLISV
jgi:hypothetical protein